MPDAFHAEFTGERVIPGRVEDNLFNEHLARYRFAAQVLRDAGSGGKLLDAGCGAGYGTEELAKSGVEVLGIDISEEAIAHARGNYSDTNIRFEQASCTAIPAEAGEFRLIAAFEVIEHLSDWRGFLREAFRVLDDAGMLLVSTPNRLYYAESRQKAGPNPFHVHEFTEAEFRSELARVFPQVKVLLQNHVEGIGFSGAETEGAALQISERKADPDGANFFLAVCGKQPLPRIASFVFIPDSGNVLQTRERHIALLDGEILKKNQWIEREQIDRRRMLDKVRDMEGELEEHNRWAQQANAEAERRAELVAALQTEVRRSNEWAQVRDAEALERGHAIERLQEELRKSNEWAQVRDAEAVERGRRVEQLQDEVSRAVAWAKDREAEALERAQRVAQLQDEVGKAVAWAQDREAEAAERGRRVVELQDEVAKAVAWATDRETEAGERGKRVVELQTELAVATEWATRRDAEAEERGERIVQLQAEVEERGRAIVQVQQDNSAQYQRLEEEMAASSVGYEAAIEQWRREKEAADRWAMETERRLSAERDAAREAFAAKGTELEKSLEHLAALQLEADRLRAQLADATGKLDMIAQSRWVKLGRMARVGPEIHRN